MIKKRKNLLDHLDSERGSVLLFVLAFGAILLVVVMSLSSRLAASMDRQTSRVLYHEYVEFIQSMRAQLEDPFNCATALATMPFNNQVTNSPTGLKIGRVALRYGRLNNATQISDNWESRPGGIKIQSVHIKAPNFTKLTDIQHADPSGLRYDIYRGELIFLPARPAINVISANRDYFRIKLFFAVRGGQIQGCFGETSVAAQCMAIGGAYDWRTNVAPYTYPDYRCHPDRKCFTSPQGLVTSAGACVSPYTAVEIGLFMDGGTRFLCQWCNTKR